MPGVTGAVTADELDCGEETMMPYLKSRGPRTEGRSHRAVREERTLRWGRGGWRPAGAAPGSRNVPETRYEDFGGRRETLALVREAGRAAHNAPGDLPEARHPAAQGDYSFTARRGTGRPCSARAVAPRERGALYSGGGAGDSK
jgi:hypothetical protein